MSGLIFIYNISMFVNSGIIVFGILTVKTIFYVCLRIYGFNNFSLPSNNCRMCNTSINSSRCRQYSRPCSRRSNIPHFSRRCNNQRYSKCKGFRLVGGGGKGYEGILGTELCRSGISYLYYNNIESFFAFLVTSTQILSM